MAAPNNNNANQNIQSNTLNAPSRGAGNIADDLLAQGRINQQQVKEVKFEAVKFGKSVDQVLLEKGYASEAEIAQSKAKLFNTEFVDLTGVYIQTEVLQKIPQEYARKNMAVAFEDVGSAIKVAMSDPLDLQKVKFLQALIGKPIKPYYSSPTAIQRVIDTKYGAQVGEEVEEALEEVEDVVSIKSTSSSSQDLSEDISRAPVSKIVNMILEYAAKFKASDIHIEPRETKLAVRYRLDGVMSEKLSLPSKLTNAVVSRIKILSNLKIDEHRVPQDGRFQVKFDNSVIDMRVSIVPTVYGEKVVMRLLEKGGAMLSLEQTGMRGMGYKLYMDALQKTQGIILVTGPTGSGKTQTLASSLTILNKPDINIMTLENPVEIRVDGVNQVQVNPDVGLTFANGLRSFLRQDPDVIMVGEIRDKETAELAIQASLTGHLVLATLHTNSAAGALPRLIDMGIPPYLLSSTINVVVAQRLVRRLNDKFKVAYEAPQEVINEIQTSLSSVTNYDIYKVVGDPNKVELFKGADTPQAQGNEYSGRVGVFEVMPISDTINHMILAQKSTNDIEAQAIKEGMITILQDGFMKAIEGITTVEEVLRVRN